MSTDHALDCGHKSGHPGGVAWHCLMPGCENNLMLCPAHRRGGLPAGWAAATHDGQGRVEVGCNRVVPFGLAVTPVAEVLGRAGRPVPVPRSQKLPGYREPW